MRAVWNDAVIAEAPRDELVRIEGNWYFPPTTLRREYFRDSAHRTECFWKGTAHYYDVDVNGNVNDAAAWYYPQPMDGSRERVGADYANYVAFWRGVEVTD
jgi:uncharacterized protein (DUF427 family)